MGVGVSPRVEVARAADSLVAKGEGKTLSAPSVGCAAATGPVGMGVGVGVASRVGVAGAAGTLVAKGVGETLSTPSVGCAVATGPVAVGVGVARVQAARSNRTATGSKPPLKSPQRIVL